MIFMGVVENSKLAIVGAGSVGASLAYAALIRGSARHVALYDINEAKVDAEVLDLAHGTQFTGVSDIVGSKDLIAVEGAHVVVITAGAKQHPGQTRLDLAATNVRLLEQLMPDLVQHAPEAFYVLVTNPCDVLTVAAHRMSELPPHRVFSSGTVLDTSRLRRLLADRAGISTASVHAYIAGEHGDTGFPVWSNARIGSVPILDWRSPESVPPFAAEELDRIAIDVRDAAYKVIKGKGATNYAIGLAGARIVEALLGDEHAIMPVSTVLGGLYGVDGIALSVPSVVSASGAVPVTETPFAADELTLLHRSADTLAASLRTLGL
ncbi:L-lactate dehydrogenase [Hoyosella subflava DQS3-9A1]|uniref:L-lactate dehydrogenase n=2 Tax=Hoyosella TaxID=697025 RepID=F6ENU7_HOYSD|nr:L-lactate dehydrogenase [Hoyosella subflava DQS3-9A1]